MTGFASIRGNVAEKALLLEAKSVNHRFCEVNVRLPGRYSAWELPIQKHVRRRFERGRIDIFVKEESCKGLSELDWAQFRKAHQEMRRLCRELKINESVRLEDLLHFKQHYFRDENHVDLTAQWTPFEALLNKLLDRLDKMRCREGRQLGKWFHQKIPELQALLRVLKRCITKHYRAHKQKLKNHIKELGLDRLQSDVHLAPELAMMTDKIDVTEEIVRLETHLEAFRDILRQGGAIGRKIDFLMQEVSREINTIASKSQNSEISSSAVQFKTEIEKIREQAGNVE